MEDRTEEEEEVWEVALEVGQGEGERNKSAGMTVYLELIELRPTSVCGQVWWWWIWRARLERHLRRISMGRSSLYV